MRCRVRMKMKVGVCGCTYDGEQCIHLIYAEAPHHVKNILASCCNDTAHGMRVHNDNCPPHTPSRVPSAGCTFECEQYIFFSFPPRIFFFT